MYIIKWSREIMSISKFKEIVKEHDMDCTEDTLEVVKLAIDSYVRAYALQLQFLYDIPLEYLDAKYVDYWIGHLPEVKPAINQVEIDSKLIFWERYSK